MNAYVTLEKENTKNTTTITVESSDLIETLLVTLGIVNSVANDLLMFAKLNLQSQFFLHLGKAVTDHLSFIFQNQSHKERKTALKHFLCILYKVTSM